MTRHPLYNTGDVLCGLFPSLDPTGGYVLFLSSQFTTKDPHQREGSKSSYVSQK